MRTRWRGLLYTASMSPRSWIALLTCTLALAGCGGETDSAEDPTSAATSSADASQGEGLLDEHGLDGLDARQVVDRLDRVAVADRPKDLMVSVRPDELLVSTADGAKEESLPMPEDEFYLSIAPYADSTHECFFHSLTTCRGELADEEVEVTITAADGEVLVDETRRTFDNGFVGVWLPRDLEATVTVRRGDQEGSAQITTGGDDLTCLTTLQLT